MKVMGSLFAAFRFLTILPLPGNSGHSEEELRQSLVYFSLVGLCLGSVAAGFAFVFFTFLPPLVAALCVTFALLVFSGGLHLDGLADTADGLCSARTREKIMEIMRDSRIGAMGVTAVIMMLLLKIFTLAEFGGSDVWRAAMLMPLAGRYAIILLMNLLPYARTSGGLATLFYKSGRLRVSLLAIFFLFLFLAFSLFGSLGIITVAAVTIVIVVFSWFCNAKIGGATGDTLGAGCEIAEATTSFVLCLALAV